MAEKDPNGPSLELPQLGFGRRKRGPKIEPEVADRPTEAVEMPRAGSDRPASPDLDPQPVRRSPVAEETPTSVEPVAPAVDPVAAGGERKADKPPREFRLPAIGGIPASMITGALVGVLTVGLTAAGFRLCEVVQGTPSCGKPGMLLLVAILIVMVYVGKLLLMAFALPDPGSTSFLAIGLLTVLALLFLVDVLFAWWMIIVIPVVAMLTYALSHWVSTAFVEPADH